MRRILLHGGAFLKSDAKSGIPRVIHELARRVPGMASEGEECLVLMRVPAGEWVRITPGWMTDLMRWVAIRRQALWRRRRGLRMAAAAGDRAAYLRLPVAWIAYVAASALFRLAHAPLLLAGRRVHPGKGDTLVLLDYESSVAPAVLAARARGAKVVAVVYDLLPITHPECFLRADETADWLDWLARHADHLLGISRDVEQAILRQWPGRARPPGHFLLGADFAPADPSAPAPRLDRVIAPPCFLMVGTLEPRKGHAEALDAFESLWARGVDSRLLIIGREGWLVDGLVRRLRGHRELGRRLHWMDDADDGELAAAYLRATALIAASRGEGFGLPLVEAQMAGLPVIAADIPVFREVGGPSVRTYPSGDSGRLAAIVEEWSASPPPRLVGFRWRGWQEAAADFLSQVSDVSRG